MFNIVVIMNKYFYQIQLTVDNCIYHVFFDREEIDISIFSTLSEGRRIDIGSAYYCYKHPAHSPVGKTHYEVFYKKNKLFAINDDGSGHDGSSGKYIPNKPYDFLKNLAIPLRDDHLIEQLDYDKLYKLDQTMSYQLLVESASNTDIVDTVIYIDFD